MKAKVKKTVSSAKRRIRNTLSPPGQSSISRTSSTGELQGSNLGTPELRASASHNASDISVGVIGPSLDVPLRPSEKMVAVPTQDPAESKTKIDPPGFVWSGLKVLQGVLREGAELFSPLASAVADVSQCIEVFEKEAQVRKEYQTLKADLDASFANLTRLLAAARTPATKAAVAQAVDAIKNEIESVVEKNKRSKATGLKDAIENVDEIESFYRRTQHIMTQLIICVNTNLLEAANEQAKDQRVKSLPDSPDARYHSAQATKLHRGACMPNTRVQLLQELWSWSEDPQSHQIFWLNGMAGTGKTTIAYSLCEQLQRAGRLGASFFCSRQLSECREVNRIVPSIARQLSCMSVFRDRLSEVLEEVPEAYNRPLGEQFERLIAAPLRLAGDSFPANQVVVVDALDECEDKDSVDQLLEVVLSQGRAVPLRFFVTSRPEAKIHDRMMDERHVGMRHEMRLHELDRKVSQEDIRTYLTAELRRAKVTPSELDALVARADALFIYAATVVRYVSYDNFLRSSVRLKRVLGISGASTGSPERHVDSLYESILEQAMGDPDMEETESVLMADVLGTVVCAREPLSLESIGRLLGLEDIDQVASALRPLASVLHVPKTTDVVVALHESFPNYILDVNRSGRFWCMPQKRNASMAYQCFGLIEQVNPPFNICKLESSFLLDDEVPDLEEKIQRHINNTLLYACCHWAEHMELSDWAEQFVALVQRLMEKRLFLWIEVMNLTKCQSKVGATLSKTIKWSQMNRCPIDTVELIRDALHFVKVFYMGLAWRSTPHIYITGLLSWPKDRTLSRKYAKLIDCGVLMTGTATMKPTFRALGIVRTSGSVCGVAYSPTGAHIVSALSDHSVRIWDAYTGQQVGQPLAGHIKCANSVAYSPDGVYIVSGSEDSTLRIWDAHSGQQVGQPLTGHTGAVNSVAFSPNGTHIVSGSDDRTMRIWDAHSGQQVGQPLMGHTGCVTSAVYSPDGAYIVSGSYDYTLRIWDAQTAQQVGQPLTGHTHQVHSVIYSPNGMHIISGSSDCSIRIWDTLTGQQVGQALTGNMDSIHSVACSPDGTYIAAGSVEDTLYIWNSESGQQAGQPLTGHTGPIWSVAYSPDGAYIASGSHDDTLRIWNTRINQEAEQPLAGHARGISSVAYSPDGTRIVSGSDDHTLCIWDAHTGQLVGQPLIGHTGYICSVAYSPDGAHIASGSFNWTLCIWDAHTSKLVVRLITTHISILSVAYSPDGTRIVSGCAAKTLHIWDAHSGQQVGQPLTGHTDDVNSVAFSPNGTHIVSGSADRTMRIWDARSGQQVGQPLMGHTGWVTSAVYSPDGTRIISGSTDKTLRIWDTHSGQQVGQPLVGHAGRVSSAVYSPDGTYIASGSYDCTLCIWDTNTSKQIGQSLAGHMGSIRSIAWSPGGKQIASGSSDQSLRIWDIATIQKLAQSFTGPTNTVTATTQPSNDVRIAPSLANSTPHIQDLQTSHVSSFIYSTRSSSADINHCNHALQTHHPSLYFPQPSARCQSGCPTDRCYCDWTLNDDGWIIVGNNRRLVWVPAELRAALLRAQNTLSMYRYGFLRVDFSRALLGPDWTQCYRSA